MAGRIGVGSSLRAPCRLGCGRSFRPNQPTTGPMWGPVAIEQSLATASEVTPVLQTYHVETS